MINISSGIRTEASLNILSIDTFSTEKQTLERYNNIWQITSFLFAGLSIAIISNVTASNSPDVKARI